MASRTGVITRKDIITDQALEFGGVYAKNVQKAIDANKKMVTGAKALHKVFLDINSIQGNANFNTFLQNTHTLLAQINVDVLQQNTALRENQTILNRLNVGQREVNLTRIQQLRIDRDLERVGTAAAQRKKAEILAQGAERRNIEALTRAQQRQARETTNQSSAYIQLQVKRNQAQRTLADLLSAENRNIQQIRVAQREFDALNARLTAVDTAVRNYSRNIGNYRSAFQGLTGTMRELASTFGVATGLALFGQIIKDIFNVIKDFDRQLIAVGKTTNITGEDLKQFGREVVSLGDRLDGISVEGLLKSAEVAGQLGVRGTENILKFSTAIEKLKLTSNIISDEQVQNFAKFIEVSSDSFENADRLASVITQLGNNFAATEAEVLANATEIQKGTAVYKSSAQGILGLGAATAALGSEAESSRSAIQSTFAVINKAIALGSNLESVLKITGLTQQELSDQFKQDASGVFVKFVAGLNKAQNEGQNLALVLNDLGIKEKRAFTVVGSLATNYNLLERSMIQANDEYKANSALNTEVEAAAQSVSSILGDIKDKWNALILTTNDANNGTKKITSVLKFLRDNLSTIINLLVKAGIAWGGYKFFIATSRIQSQLMTWALGMQTTAQTANTAAAQANVEVMAENASTVEDNIQAELENTVTTEANTLATAENTIAEQAETLADTENTLATEANSLAELENTLVTDANTVATVENIATEQADTVASIENTVATEANTVADVQNTLATEANTIAEAGNTVATEANVASTITNTVATEASTVAQAGNAVATNIASTAWARFTAILKANALGLAIAAIVAIIYYVDKFNVSLEEQLKQLRAHQAEVKKNTTELLKNRDINDQNAIAIARLSDRYDELVKKTKLNSAEQKELNDIMAILSKTVPGATTAMNKYGEATAISTVKTRAYIESKRKLYEIETSKKIKENYELLKQYEADQRILNVTEKDTNGLRLEGIGFITRRNNVLKVQNTISRVWRDLTQDELAIYLKARISNEENIGIVTRNIELLKNRLVVQKEVNKETLKQEEKKKGPRTIDDIDAEIKAQEDLIGTLSDKSGKEGEAIKRKVAALKAERELIYSTTKADKDKTNTALRNMIRVRDAIYQLSQFRYSREIEINQQILDDDKSTLEQRLNAYTENLQLMESKNLETLQKELSDYAFSKEGLDKLSKSKLQIYIKEKDARIKSLLDGALAVDKLTKAELLIYEKYQFEKLNIAKKGEVESQKIIDNEVDRVHKSLEKETALYERFSDVELKNENERYRKLLQAGFKNDKLRELAVEEHERNIQKIKNNYAQKEVENQIDDLEKFLKNDQSKLYFERISAEKRAEILNELAALRKSKSDAELSDEELKHEKLIQLQFDALEMTKEIAMEFKDSLIDLSNTLFDARISNIDREIEKSDEYYNRQIELAEGDAKQQELLRNEQQKKREELEKKKKKEEIKAAIFNKALALTNIALNLAQTLIAIQLAAAQIDGLTLGIGGSIYRAVQIPLAIGTAAVQTATVIATPLPKYKDGRKDGPAEFAEVGDGFVNEVIEKKDGRAFITPNIPTLTFLEKGDKVHSSVDDYKKIQKASMMASLAMENKKLNDFQASQQFDKSYGKELLEEMVKTRLSIEKNKQNIIVNVPKSDMSHEIWKFKNTNWRS